MLNSGATCSSVKQRYWEWRRKSARRTRLAGRLEKGMSQLGQHLEMLQAQGGGTRIAVGFDARGEVAQTALY